MARFRIVQYPQYVLDTFHIEQLADSEWVERDFAWHLEDAERLVSRMKEAQEYRGEVKVIKEYD